MIAFSLCMVCQHFDPEEKEFLKCKAFANGIPPQLFTGKENHDKPYPGDNGIRFVSIKGYETVISNK